MKTCRISFILFGFVTVSLVSANSDTISNEIFVHHSVSETGIVVPESSLYLDLMDLVQSYTPTSVMESFHYLKNENIWELVKHQLWRMVSFILGYDFTDEGRSGQSIFEEPLITIPYFNYPITRHQLEGFALDSLAVYRKWQSDEL